MALRIFFVLSILLCLANPSIAAVYHLEPDGSGDFPTIQEAFDSAQPFDVIILRPGTYHEFDIEASSLVDLRSEGGPEVTFINATGGQWGIVGYDFAAPRVIDGITFHGAAITALLLEGGGTSLISDCVVYDCGVGMYLRDMNGIVEDCTITGGHFDTGTSGSGLSLRGSSPTIRNCNIAFNAGAGVVEWFSGHPDFFCNNVFGNGDGNYGGVSDPTGTNDNVSADPQFCDVSSNDLTIAGSSICTPENAPCGELIGALGVGCEATSGACCDDETGECLYTIESLCDLGGDGFTYYPGDFCDPNPCPQPAGACCLQDGSCELMGDVECGLIEGFFRGYDEPCEPNPCSVAGIGAAFEGPATLLPAHPNPSGGEVHLGLEVFDTSPVEVAVFDLAGRRVAALLNGEFSPGAYRVHWDGHDDTGRRVGSGVYFVRLHLPGRTVSRQVQILR